MALSVALALLTGGIAVPAALRSLYYAQIVPLHLPEKSGMTVGEICSAYDEVMDYCTGEKDRFSAGILSYTKQGALHFADCRRLLFVDRWLFVGAMASIAALLVYARKYSLPKFLNRRPEFWGASGMCALLLSLGAYAAADFERAFELFHRTLFPGKTNWALDSELDPIIRILPEEYFASCGFIALAVVLAATAAIVFADLKNRA